MSDFSKNLKYLRKLYNLNQEQMSKIVGKDRSLISQWESDDRNATVEDVIKLSNHFNIPMDVLVGTDLSLNDQKTYDEFELLFNKTKDILNDTERDIVRHVMQNAIDKYEQQKNNSD